MPPADGPVVTPRLLRGWPLPEPGEEGDKHERGTVLIVGGAVSTPGAVLLAGVAALRAGAGRLQVATVEATQAALGVTLPEAAVLGLPAGDKGSLSGSCVDELVRAAERADVLVIGPGLRGPDQITDLLAGVLPQLGEQQVVLDAVALLALAGAPELAAPLDGRLLLTPNSGELASLAGDEEPTAAGVARRYRAVVATRGEVAAPDGSRWVDECGGIGLGTSGSGDVLAGLAGGLLARGADPAQAGVYAQYVHGTAGDRLAARVGRTGFLARELLDEIAPVLGGLRS